MSRPTRRMNLIAIIALFVIAAGCGSSEDAVDITPQQLQFELTVEEAGVTVDGADAPVGESVSIDYGQEIVLDEDGRGVLTAGDDYEFELFKQANFRIFSADRLELVAFLKVGHLRFKASEQAEARLTLQTPNATARTLARGTEFTACQDPNGISCFEVVSGELESESGGGVKKYTEGQGAFAELGAVPGPAVCLDDGVYTKWFDAARRNEDVGPLGALVAGGPPCDVGPDGGEERSGESEQAGEIEQEGDADEDTGIGDFTGTKIPTSAGMSPVSIDSPEIGTADFLDDPEHYGEPRSLDEPVRFYIDQRVVSNQAFRAWLVSAAGQDPDKWTELAPDSWIRNAATGALPDATYPPGAGQAPVQGVRPAAAGDFCGFNDKRLPTEIEWELAAVDDKLRDVGSVQEWVSDWDAYGPGVNRGEQILRGTDDLLEPDLYYRSTVVDDVDLPVARAYAGLRCASDDVLVSSAPAVDSREPIYLDEFCDYDQDWPLVPGDGFDIGYHGPCFYHVESSRQHNEVVVMSGSNPATLSEVETDVRIRNTEGTGNFRYGLIIGAPESGYLLFTVQPVRVGSRPFLDWCLQPASEGLTASLAGSAVLYSAVAHPEEGLEKHRGESCAGGYKFGRADVAGFENRLSIRASGGSVILAVDGKDIDEAPVSMPAGDFGFFVQTYHMEKAHLHYDRLAAFSS